MIEQSAIQVQALVKIYQGGVFARPVEALRGVTFAVGRGEIFGLLGPNGAGKTTLIKVLLGIVRKTSGDARLLGRPPGDRNGRRRVGYLPENHRIPRHLSGNTALEFYGSLSGLSAGDIRRRRPEMLDLVGLAAWGKVSVKKYSKGMLQRLGLAQALLHDPDLLILDEPTDGVDPVGRSEMRSLLERLKQEGKTIFLNSHHLQEVELICDRVAILDFGLVRREGSVDDLTVRPETDLFFNLVGEEPAVRQALAGHEVLGWVVPGHGQHQVTVRVADQPDVDRTIDSLREHGVGIADFSRHRKSLEEAFLEIIQQGRAS